MRLGFVGIALLCGVANSAIASAQEATTRSEATSDAEDLGQLRAEVADQRRAIEAQIASLREQQARLEKLESRLDAALTGDQPTQNEQPGPAAAPAATPNPASQRVAANTTQAAPDEAVGVAPEDAERQPEVTALGRRGSAITKKGQLSGEIEWSYARAERNRALFRGVEVVESVLIGVFDINESRQDVFTQTLGLQYGLTDDFEVGIDVPLIARWDTSLLAPVAGSTNDDEARTIDNSANGFGIGDVEILMRKQLLAPRGFGPYLIGNLQVNIPTGQGPFSVDRNEFGEAFDAATGSGFWGVTPGITAILPSDPGVLFGSLSYTKNFGRSVDTTIPPVQILNVNPGDAISFSGGLGVSLNPRLSFNFGYAHSWGFGTETITRALAEGAEPVSQKSRDLQIGRLLFGTTYKINNTTSFNFNVESGVTDDATDLRILLRFPFVF
ncbi:transporter [Erythrobacter sp. F6033]|uniref:transporter n=1 Tax=Erythrobacter sp. F6033 TaxID=2926401 RepID=UPI001FF0E18C|nr:transporter [Erythrobacter sp. F6033]MCK0127367.1 hypothetical protein [Erythrobacter sp. F6033]